MTQHGMSESSSVSDVPLRSRVSAPRELPMPHHPDIVVWRPVSLDDRTVIMDLMRALDGVDHPTWVTPWDDVVSTLETAGVDLEVDSLLGLDAAGSALAYAVVGRAASPETEFPLYLNGGVHPDYRGQGIGRNVMAWLVARGLQVLAVQDTTLPAALVSYQEEGNTSAIRLAERAGLSVERYFTSMERVLADPVADVSIPADLRLVEFTEERAESARDARNDAFRDHWGSQPTSAARWAQFVGGEIFRYDLSYVVVDADDRVVAFALASVNEEDWAQQGFASVYIDLVGVVRDHRGQALAPAVLSALLAGAKRAGLDRAILDVDMASPTGANSLYERLGFVATERSVALKRTY